MPSYAESMLARCVNWKKEGSLAFVLFDGLPNLLEVELVRKAQARHTRARTANTRGCSPWPAGFTKASKTCRADHTEPHLRPKPLLIKRGRGCGRGRVLDV